MDFFTVTSQHNFKGVSHDYTKDLEKDHGRLEVRRYFIASIKPDAKLFAKAVRNYWGVENPLHWSLDVIFGVTPVELKKTIARLY